MVGLSLYICIVQYYILYLIIHLHCYLGRHLLAHWRLKHSVLSTLNIYLIRQNAEFNI